MALLAPLRSRLPRDFALGEPIRLCWYLSQWEDTRQSAGFHDVPYSSVLSGQQLRNLGASPQHPLFSRVDPHIGEGTTGAGWVLLQAAGLVPV